MSSGYNGRSEKSVEKNNWKTRQVGGTLVETHKIINLKIGVPKADC